MLRILRILRQILHPQGRRERILLLLLILLLKLNYNPDDRFLFQGNDDAVDVDAAVDDDDRKDDVPAIQHQGRVSRTTVVQCAAVHLTN